MKNKSLILFVSLMLSLFWFKHGCIFPQASEISQSPEEKMAIVIEDANRYILENYGIADYYPPFVLVGGVRHSPSFRIYKDYKLIGYYSEDCDLSWINTGPEDRIVAKKGDKLNKPGEMIYRYLGYDIEGKLLYNPHFPADNLGAKPDRSGLVSWGSMINQDWKALIEDESRREIRSAIEANFKKSLMKNLRLAIDQFFLYHSPGFENNNHYYETWRHFFEQLFSKDFSDKINVILLPSVNVNGLTIFRYRSGYYSTNYLRYQDKTSAFLKIHHLAVEKKDGNYKVIKGFSPINTKNDYRLLKEGKQVSISAHASGAYKCIGHSFHPNLDGLFQAPKPGAGVSAFVPSPEFHYIHHYEMNNDKPHLVFYYEYHPDRGPNSLERSGKIIVSSQKYEVTRAIPTDESVRIESHIDDADLCEVTWGGGSLPLSIPVEVTDTLNSGYIGEIYKDIEYYKLHDYSIYKLSKVLVNNPKLNAYQPLIQYPEPTPKAEVKIYSQNVLGIKLPSSVLRIGGIPFRASVKTLVNYQGEYGEEDADGINALAIELSPIGGDGELYVSEYELERALQNLERNCRVEVKNDYLSIAGRVISGDQVYEDRAPEPGEIPPRPFVLVKNAHHIENTAKNGRGLTTGILVYEKELGSGPEKRHYDIDGNAVFIHTPSVNQTKMQDVSDFDQRTDERKTEDAALHPDENFLSLPLDHVTELDLSTMGSHIAEKGYGRRDYQEHLKLKLIRFSFDAYVSKKAENIEAYRPDHQYFLPAGRLLRLEASVKKVYFKAAPWVVEGAHRIDSYMVAKNAEDKIQPQDGANLDYTKDAASFELPVWISGRLFDFSVERVLDPSYQSTNSSHFWSAGIKTKDGLIKKRFASQDEAFRTKWTLPLLPSKSPYKHRVRSEIKLGYPLIFSVKTLGTYFAKEDVLFFRPKFYHIAKDGRVRSDIALFYQRDGQLVRIGSKEDGLKNYAIFKSFAGLDNQELIEETQTMYAERQNSYGSEEDAVLDRAALHTASTYRAQIARPVFVSSPSVVLSSSAFRVFAAGSQPHPSEVSPEKAGMSLQKWYGSYQLPLTTLVYGLDEEGRPDLNQRISEGAIGLGFDIGLARENNRKGYDLSYVTDSYNGWIKQGYSTEGGLPLGLVALYSIDKSRDEDLRLK